MLTFDTMLITRSSQGQQMHMKNLTYKVIAIATPLFSCSPSTFVIIIIIIFLDTFRKVCDNIRSTLGT